MLTIALTGGIGSGKSTVCNIFHKLSLHNSPISIVKIIDADQIAKSLLSGSLNSSSTLDKVRQLFGADLFNKGQLDRLQLRELIFSSITKKQQLESLLHPLVYQEIFSTIQNYQLRYKTNNLIIIIAIQNVSG